MNSPMLRGRNFSTGDTKGRQRRVAENRGAPAHALGRIVAAQIGKGNKSLKGLKRSRVERLTVGLCVGDERGNNSGVRF